MLMFAPGQGYVMELGLPAPRALALMYKEEILTQRQVHRHRRGEGGIYHRLL